MMGFMSRRVLGSVFVVLVLCSVTVFGQTTVIKAGKVLHPKTGKIESNQMILIEGSKIKEIGAKLTIPKDATVIDLSSKTVMPGMFDAHAHLCMNMQQKRDAGSYYITTLRDSTAMRAIQGVANARSMLEHGFTTVRDIGNGANYADTELRRSIEQGIVPGPTIINAGRIIAPFGGQFQMQADRPGLGEPEYFYADTRDELKKAVRKNIHFGAKVIKLVIDDQDYVYSVEDIKFVVKEAKLAGLKVAAHAWTERGARHAAEAGVASIEHGVRLNAEIAKIAAEKNVAVAPIPFTELEARLNGEPKSNERFNKFWFINPVNIAYKNGVKLIWGPDVIYTTKEYPRGRLSIETLDEWKQTEVPVGEILQALTTNAAEVLGVEETRGALQKGMMADIIAVDENPLVNIDTLKSVQFVMKEGTVFKR